MSPGYTGWMPGHPTSSCGSTTADCVLYTYNGSGGISDLPMWIDILCEYPYVGGICELHPSSISFFYKLNTYIHFVQDTLFLNVENASGHHVHCCFKYSLLLNQTP